MEITVRMDGEGVTLPLERFLEINRQAETEAAKARDEMRVLGGEIEKFMQRNEQDRQRSQRTAFDGAQDECRKTLRTILSIEEREAEKRGEAVKVALRGAFKRILKVYDEDTMENNEMRERRAMTASQTTGQVPSNVKFRQFTEDEMKKAVGR